MAFDADRPLPFGLKKVDLIPFDPAGANSTTLSTDPDDYENFGFARSGTATITGTSKNTAGDDQILATEYYDEMCEGDLEQAGMNISSTAFIWGQTVSIDGVDPNIIHSVTRDVSTPRPHFGIRMRSRSSRGGTFERVIQNAQAIGGPNLTQSYGEFGNATVPYQATANELSKLIRVAHYQTNPVDVPPGP